MANYSSFGSIVLFQPTYRYNNIVNVYQVITDEVHVFYFPSNKVAVLNTSYNATKL